MIVTDMRNSSVVYIMKHTLDFERLRSLMIIQRLPRLKYATRQTLSWTGSYSCIGQIGRLSFADSTMCRSGVVQTDLSLELFLDLNDDREGTFNLTT